jgi:acyl carrier protein
MDVEAKVKAIIATQLMVDEEEVTPKSTLVDDLGADSLDVVEIVVQIEEDFDLEIPDEEAENFKTVQDVIDGINRNMKI